MLDRLGAEHNLKKEWACRQGEMGPPIVTNICLTLRKECMELHKRHRVMFLAKVSYMVFQDIVPHLKEKVRADLKKQLEDLKKQAKKEESTLWEELRESFSTKKDDIPTFSLTSCTLAQLRGKEENHYLH